MRKYFTSREVAEQLSQRMNTLRVAIFRGRMPAPKKMGGNFLWTQIDIDRARILFGKTIRFPKHTSTADLCNLVQARIG